MSIKNREWYRFEFHILKLPSRTPLATTKLHFDVACSRDPKYGTEKQLAKAIQRGNVFIIKGDTDKHFLTESKDGRHKGATIGFPDTENLLDSDITFFGKKDVLQSKEVLLTAYFPGPKDYKRFQSAFFRQQGPAKKL